MSVIGVFNVKGSPGATMLALALAAHSRAQGAVLIEADTAGGDLALRFGIPQQPGLAQFAARARHTAGRREVLDGLVRTVGGDSGNPVELLPAPVEPAAVQAAATALAANPETLTAAGAARLVVLDLGRLSPQTPGIRLLGSCDAAVLVVRGDAVSLGHAREAAWLKDLPVRCGFVLVDTGPYRAAEAAGVLDLPCLSVVPVGRRPLRGRHAANAIRDLCSELAAAAAAPSHARDLVDVKGR